MRLILITGGARSGKSDHAQQLAASLCGEDVLFVATAEPLDAEMVRRIAAHRQARPAAWRTVEAPRQVGPAIQQAQPANGVVVDCLTLLVSNLLLSLGDDPAEDSAERATDLEVQGLLEAARRIPGPFIVVTNEVGLGLVPVNRLARLYRDLLGRANATLAREAEQVVLLVSGIPLELKSLSQRGSSS
jgi:adenosyl cobinamide kinase/adenosyl cobinamide phosphate guanylyltransferase